MVYSWSRKQYQNNIIICMTCVLVFTKRVMIVKETFFFMIFNFYQIKFSMHLLNVWYNFVSIIFFKIFLEKKIREEK